MPLVSFSELIAAAQAGEVVSFPTDTVPALACLPTMGDAIFRLKERPLHKPLILMAATRQDLEPYLGGTPPAQAQWQELMERYWPGALTLVLPAAPSLPLALNPLQDGTVGVRVPNCPQALEILKLTGPLATTSANLTGAPPCQTLAAIAYQFPSVLVLAGSPQTIQQPLGSGKSSTVAQWTTSSWQILRQGEVILPVPNSEGVW